MRGAIRAMPPIGLGRKDQDIITPEILEMIKNDDPSFFSLSDEEDKFSNVAFLYLQPIIDNNAYNCAKILNKICSNKISPYSPYTLDLSKASRKMTRLLHDVFPLNQHRFNCYIPITMTTCENQKLFPLPQSEYSSMFSQAIRANDLKTTKYFLDNIIVDLNSYDICQTPDSTKNPEIYMLMVTHGIKTSVVPTFALENNMIDFIHTLINDYDFYINSSNLMQDTIKNMIRNNAFEAVKLIINTEGVKNVLHNFITYCALFNCDEMLELIINSAKDKLTSDCGKSAILAAARLGRINILKLLLLIPNTIDTKSVKNAIKKATENGYPEIVEMLEENLKQGIFLPEESAEEDTKESEFPTDLNAYGSFNPGFM